MTASASPGWAVIEWAAAGRGLEAQSGDLHVVAAFPDGALVALIDGLGTQAEPVYRATTELLSEITAVVLLPEAASGAPVTSIAAPVLDNRGAVVLNLAAHPFQELSLRDVMAIGRRLVEAAGGITAAADGAAT